MLPEPLKLKAEKEAEKEKVSFGELIRRALEKYLLLKKGGHDPFLSSQTLFHDEGPMDVAEHHNDYLLKKGPH
ncbi:MAG: hypothetical protein Q7S00_04785 [bacterium]|nr:hypothetical protein [bacterium]